MRTDGTKDALVSVEDLAGLSKPLTKLIEVVAAGMGNLYRPVGIVREANAEGERIRALAAADADAVRTIAVGESDARRTMELARRGRNVAELEHISDIQRRATLRATAEAAAEQENLERIAAKAAKYISDTVSEEPVDADWRTRFFRNARDVSDDTMRELWAQVLADEVGKPGTYSPRTLDALRVMSKPEAEAFQRFCGLIFEPNYVVRMDQGTEPYGVGFEDISVLQVAGLVRDSFDLVKWFPRKDSAITQGHCLVVTHDIGLSVGFRQPTPISAYMLTGVGRELRKLVHSKPNSAYIADVKKELLSAGLEVSEVQIQWESGRIRCGREVLHPDQL